jgi:hypothetical protein
MTFPAQLKFSIMKVVRQAIEILRGKGQLAVDVELEQHRQKSESSSGVVIIVSVGISLH